MDLGGLGSYGRSSTRTAWITNPVRRVVWWLVGPYFRGAGVEIDRTFRQLTLTAEDASPGLRTRSEGAIPELVRSIVTSHIGGLRKDALAVAHRLAGLEDEVATMVNEAAENARSRATVSAVQEALEHIRQSLQVITETSTDRIEALHRQGSETSTWITELQQEFRSAIDTINGRIDFFARGTPLNAGSRISVGKDGLVLVASPDGTHLLVRQDDLIGRRIVDGQEWEPHVRQEIERSARPDGIAVDAGAYVGLHTLTMSRYFKTVHAFEPQRGIFQMLAANLALNNRMNVVAHNIGLYDRRGGMRPAPQERQDVVTPLIEGQLDYANIKNAAGISYDFVAEGVSTVAAITLDEMALEDVAIIKIDTQGADLRVLKGAEQTIRRCRPTILFEWERDLSRHHGAVLENYIEFFHDLDYDLHVLQEIAPGRQTDYIARPRA